MSILSAVSYATSVVSEGSSTSPPTYLTGHTPAPWYRFSLRTIVIIILPILSLIGAFGTWTLGGTNGTFKSIVKLIEHDDALFPGSDSALLKSYTGIGPIDNQLSILVTFFSPVVDSSNGACALFAILGSGQFGAIWTLMMMESMRTGNVGKAVSYVGTVGFILQNISFTITAPLWLLLHLLTSTVSKPFPGTYANSVLLVSPWDLRILPLSVTLGFIVPTILMGLPSPDVVSWSAHQRYIALWQPFPVWTVIIHWTLRSVAQWIANTFTSKDLNKAPTPLGTSYLSNTKHVYGFVIALCMITHIPVVLITLLPSCVFPDSMSAIAKLAQQDVFSVFVPYYPSLSYQVPSLAEGALTFLQWDLYVGSTAFLLWAMLLYRNATMERNIVDPNTSLPVYRELFLGERLEDRKLWTKLLVKIAIWCTVSGPVGASAILLWERDTVVRQKIKQGI